MKLSRKEFLRSIVGIGIGAAGISALAACGGSDGDDEPPVVDGPPSNRNCQANGTNVAIGSNHGHALMTVSKDDVVAAAEKMYTMSGGGHDHTVTVTAAMFMMLKNNTSVTATSTSSAVGGAHTHSVTITCA